MYRYENDICMEGIVRCRCAWCEFSFGGAIDKMKVRAPPTCNDGAVLELRSNGVLNELIRFVIYIRGGFIHD